MRTFVLTAAAGLLLAGSSSLVFAQADVSISAKNPAGVSDNRTDSPIAHKRPDGVTVAPPGTMTAPGGVMTGPATTGSVVVAPAPSATVGVTAGPATSGTPTSTYPYAAPHEVRNGCRTVYNETTNTRVLVDC